MLAGEGGAAECRTGPIATVGEAAYCFLGSLARGAQCLARVTPSKVFLFPQPDQCFSALVLQNKHAR